jgi:hypothetical protein
MNRPFSVFSGIAIIVIGLLFLISTISPLNMGHLWPVFLLLPGCLFCAGYFQNRKNTGLLFPGSFLIIIGLFFYYCIIAGWTKMGRLWPVFIWAPGAGFMAMYFGGKHEKGLVYAAGILGFLGFIFFMITFKFRHFWPILLMAAGFFLIASQMITSRQNKIDE